MKKIGILTYHRAYSYGAKLQAYALVKYMNSIGFRAEDIDYGNIGEEKLRKIGFKNLKDLIVTTLCYICSTYSEPIRIRRFNDFLKMIPHSSIRYNKKNIVNANSEYDYFITGSDQVWNPKYNEGDFTYLLDFVKDNKKKFSYAASFGTTVFSNEILNKYYPLLVSFHKILVRESTGQDLLEKQMGLNSEIVLDPTFLIPCNHWKTIAHYPFKKHIKYILSFQIIQRDPIYDRMLEHLHRLLGYEVIELKDSFRYKPWRWRTYTQAGPLEFLGLIKNAEIVVTNSFHATVFSILFNRPFFCLKNSFGFNSRMIDLTKSVGLQSRMFDSSTSFPLVDEIEIDYKTVDGILQNKISETKKIIERTFIK